MEMTVEQQRAIAIANARARAAGQDLTPEDPIRAQVRQEMQADRAKGMPELYGASRQYLQGATFNLADEVLAGLSTPIEMVKRRTFSPVEGYNYAKAREDLELEDARKRSGALGTAVEIGGGVITGSGLAKGGLTFMPKAAGAGLGARVAGAAADGAVIGGIAAAGDASGSDRLTEGAKGVALGAAIGGGVQAAAPVVSNVAGRALGFVDAYRDPTGFAERQVARALSESGRRPAEVVRDMRLGARDGQPFAMADSLGNPGQRLLSTVARNPGAGRTQAVGFLDGRQAGQGRRVANALAEGLDAPQTAAQTRDAMKAARGADADVNYGAARAQAGAVDPTDAIQAADDFLQPGASGVMRPQTSIADDSVEGAVRRARSYLTDDKSVITDFAAAQRAKIELDRIMEKGGSVANAVKPIRNALDDALAAASKPYAQARDTFRQQSKAIEAIDFGKVSANRGRSEDVLQQFGRMTPEEQGGFRVGYADSAIERVQNAPFSANKVKEFTSDASKAELPAIAAPGQGQRLMDRLGREDTMFQTRAMSLGGSRTTENLADDAASAINPEIFGNIASGNYGTALRNLVVRSGDNLGGLTPKVREELARLLLATGKDPGLTAMVANAIGSDAKRKALAQALLRGGMGGAAIGSERANAQPRR
jgi:hypothetical protein